jgi:predicted RNA-binding protein YlqC (UPF0109 family)
LWQWTAERLATPPVWKLSVIITPEKTNKVTVNAERLKYWLDQGAQASDTLRTALKTAGAWVASSQLSFSPVPSPVELVTSIVKSLVDKPENVEARWLETEKTVEINVLPEDRGKVIGKRGKTIDSLADPCQRRFCNGPGERIDVKLREE